MTKRPKVEVDRISNLPDPVISHILSFLPTKDAVRTSALSTFWNQQWTSVTQLRFNDNLAPGVISTCDTKANFVNFVYRVLLHIKVACPDLFQLKCSLDYGVSTINSWVSAALSRNVQHIDLSVSMGRIGMVPRGLFSCRQLVVLKLGSGFLLNVPILITLVSLKILHLDVLFDDNDSLSRLVSSCPVLEELKLVGIISDNVNEVKISSITLKRLTLKGLNPWHESPHHSYEVVLNTPGLQYLVYLDSSVPSSFTTGILHCLDKARIDVGVHDESSDSPAALASVVYVMKSLLAGISCALYLHLSSPANLVFYLIWLPKFPRLIKLELEEVLYWDFLLYFLAFAPALATISVQCSYLKIDRAPLNFPLQISSKLKQIEIKDFQGLQSDLEIVKCFLEKSDRLNKVIISYPLKISKEKEAEISKKLLMLPRASACCVVEIT